MRIEWGAWSFKVVEGALRTLHWNGVEVIRGVECPLRDENWATYPQETTVEAWDEVTGTYRREFSVAGGTVSAVLTVVFQPEGTLTASLTLQVDQDFLTNRAGFVVLHPLDGVAGYPLEIVHSNGTTEHTHFPRFIAPSQPAFDIVALKHELFGIEVAYTFSGDVFEMEDQRNWADASFKTYCRPLALPTPYRLAAGETVHQEIQVQLTSRNRESQQNLSLEILEQDNQEEAENKPQTAPTEILVAVEKDWAEPNPDLAGLPILLRLYPNDTGAEDWVGKVAEGREVDLEVVIPDGVSPQTHLFSIANSLKAQGIYPRNVIALPEAYLKSYQPSGAWPQGATPTDAAKAARFVFPEARIGVGMFTNFAELNRCRPEPGVGDYLTFSITSIVHTADDESVEQTRRCIPHLLESAKAMAPGLPIRLGLVSIGMRTNPYGVGVVPNPELAIKPMVQADQRQHTLFAAEHARKLYQWVQESGCEAVALCAMCGAFSAQGDLLRVVREFDMRYKKQQN